MNLKTVLDYSLTYPAQINEQIAAAKYVLNIPAWIDSPLALHRINKALAMGCHVVSAPSKDKELDDMYADFIHIGDVHELVNNLDDLPNKKSYEEFYKEFGEDILKKQLNNLIHLILLFYLVMVTNGVEKI